MRHTSVEVPPGTCYGQTDVPLKNTFPREAQAVQRALALYGPCDEAYTSPLSRCIRLADYCGYPHARRDNRLLEINFGAWEMQLYDRIKDPRLQQWYDDYWHVAPTGGEPFTDQLLRVRAFLAELSAAPRRSVVLFTHAGVIACVRILLQLNRPEDAFNALPPYGSVQAVSIASGQNLPLPQHLLTPPSASV